MRIFDEAISRQPASAKTAFVEVLNWLAHADNVLHGQETAFLAELIRVLELPELELASAPEWQDSWADELAPVAHYALMQGALLAAVDGHVDVSERECLEFLAEQLDAEPGSVDEMLDWAVVGHQWMGLGLEYLARDVE